MADLLGNLRSAGSSLRAFTEALGVVQGNIANGATPGYARRVAVLAESTPDTIGLEPRGVRTLGAESTRVQSMEESVWLQSGQLGRSKQMQRGLEPLVRTLEPGAEGGVADALQRLLTSFRSLSTSSGSEVLRQQVLGEARSMAAAMGQSASALQSYQGIYETQLQGTVTRVNQLVAQIAAAEKAALGAGSESLADTRVHGALEELSSLIDFKVLRGSDGSLTLLGGGQTPLLQGGQAFPLTVSLAQGAGGPERPAPQLLDAFGNNAGGTFRSGEIAGLLELTNRVLPALIGGGGQPGSLNQLAQELGTQINQALAPGKALFAWETPPAGSAALSFRVSGDFLESDLPAAGAALGNLAALGLDTANVPALGGKTFRNFLTAQVQTLAVEARDAAEQSSTGESLLNQAKNLRSQTSGVTLEQEAVELLQLQHSFQAVSRLISTLNDLVESVLTMKR